MELVGNNIPKLSSSYDFSNQNGDLNYLTKTSAVFSSNIEGNSLNINSYMNYKLNKNKTGNNKKEIEEIDTLISAYKLAQKTPLNENTLLECHRILSNTLLIKSKRGKYRQETVAVFGKSGLVYMAIEPEFVKGEMKILFDDINTLINTSLSADEVFYHAALIHLKFVQIHPFMDGNGRAARLLEKWFVSEKLGSKFWKLTSEDYYKTHQQTYYTNINLGVNYYELDFDICINFLCMLANSLKP